MHALITGVKRLDVEVEQTDLALAFELNFFAFFSCAGLTARLYAPCQLDSGCFFQIKLHHVVLGQIIKYANARCEIGMQFWSHYVSVCVDAKFSLYANALHGN